MYQTKQLRNITRNVELYVFSVFNEQVIYRYCRFQILCIFSKNLEALVQVSISTSYNIFSDRISEKMKIWINVFEYNLIEASDIILVQLKSTSECRKERLEIE